MASCDFLSLVSYGTRTGRFPLTRHRRGRPGLFSNLGSRFSRESTEAGSYDRRSLDRVRMGQLIMGSGEFLVALKSSGY